MRDALLGTIASYMNGGLTEYVHTSKPFRTGVKNTNGFDFLALSVVAQLDDMGEPQHYVTLDGSGDHRLHQPSASELFGLTRSSQLACEENLPITARHSVVNGDPPKMDVIIQGSRGPIGIECKSSTGEQDDRRVALREVTLCALAIRVAECFSDPEQFKRVFRGSSDQACVENLLVHLRSNHAAAQQPLLLWHPGVMIDGSFTQNPFDAVTVSDWALLDMLKTNPKALERITKHLRDYASGDGITPPKQGEQESVTSISTDHFKLPVERSLGSFTPRVRATDMYRAIGDRFEQIGLDMLGAIRIGSMMERSALAPIPGVSSKKDPVEDTEEAFARRASKAQKRLEDLSPGKRMNALIAGSPSYIRAAALHLHVHRKRAGSSRRAFDSAVRASREDSELLIRMLEGLCSKDWERAANRRARDEVVAEITQKRAQVIRECLGGIEENLFDTQQLQNSRQESLRDAEHGTAESVARSFEVIVNNILGNKGKQAHTRWRHQRFQEQLAPIHEVFEQYPLPEEASPTGAPDLIGEVQPDAIVLMESLMEHPLEPEPDARLERNLYVACAIQSIRVGHGQRHALIQERLRGVRASATMPIYATPPTSLGLIKQLIPKARGMQSGFTVPALMHLVPESRRREILNGDAEYLFGHIQQNSAVATLSDLDPQVAGSLMIWQKQKEFGELSSYAKPPKGFTELCQVFDAIDRAIRSSRNDHDGLLRAIDCAIERQQSLIATIRERAEASTGEPAVGIEVAQQCAALLEQAQRVLTPRQAKRSHEADASAATIS